VAGDPRANGKLIGHQSLNMPRVEIGRGRVLSSAETLRRSDGSGALRRTVPRTTLRSSVSGAQVRTGLRRSPARTRRSDRSVRRLLSPAGSRAAGACFGDRANRDRCAAGFRSRAAPRRTWATASRHSESGPCAHRGDLGSDCYDLARAECRSSKHGSCRRSARELLSASVICSRKLSRRDVQEAVFAGRLSTVDWDRSTRPAVHRVRPTAPTVRGFGTSFGTLRASVARSRSLRTRRTVTSLGLV
jgi:hypothetical protein